MLRHIRSWISSIVALSLVGGLLVAAETSASKAQKPRVMMLGTFHFQGSTTDGISVTMGDVLAPERQAEIEEVVERLAKFLPTKIMVEAVPEREGELNATYRSYLAGEHELTASESQQIAMRLAKNQGHERIYAVDHKQEMDFGRVMAAGQTAGQEGRDRFLAPPSSSRTRTSASSERSAWLASSFKPSPKALLRERIDDSGKEVVLQRGVFRGGCPPSSSPRASAARISRAG